VEVFALARQYSYIAGSRWFEAVAGKPLEAASGQLPRETIEAASARGRALNFWQLFEGF
jgi:hypothetical protein